MSDWLIFSSGMVTGAAIALASCLRVVRDLLDGNPRILRRLGWRDKP